MGKTIKGIHSEFYANPSDRCQQKQPYVEAAAALSVAALYHKRSCNPIALFDMPFHCRSNILPEEKQRRHGAKLQNKIMRNGLTALQ